MSLRQRDLPSSDRVRSKAPGSFVVIVAWALLALLGPARARGVVYLQDGAGSVFQGGLAITASIQTHGDSTSTGGGSGSGSIDSIVGDCADYTVSTDDEVWHCARLRHGPDRASRADHDHHLGDRGPRSERDPETGCAGRVIRRESWAWRKALRRARPEAELSRG